MCVFSFKFFRMFFCYKVILIISSILSYILFAEVSNGKAVGWCEKKEDSNFTISVQKGTTQLNQKQIKHYNCQPVWLLFALLLDCPTTSWTGVRITFCPCSTAQTDLVGHHWAVFSACVAVNCQHDYLGNTCCSFLNWSHNYLLGHH